MNYYELLGGVVLLALSGIGVVAWWGVRRLIQMSDDGAKLLTKLNDNLVALCERQSRIETWMKMHEKSDDERHEESQRSYQILSNIVIDKRKAGGYVI